MNTSRSLYALTLIAAAGMAAEVVAQACGLSFPGDVNNDLVVNFDDLNEVLSHWNTPGPAGDVDGSGFVDFDDLNLVLSHWEEAYCPVHPDYDIFTLPFEPLATPEFGGTALPPIPADFFGPGSEPFVGVVSLPGGMHNPLPLLVDPLVDHENDLIARRLGCMDPGEGAVQVVPIEIVELSLTSIEPITVVIEGEPTTWDVYVELSAPAGTGESVYEVFWDDMGTSGQVHMYVPVKVQWHFAPSEDVQAVIEGLMDPDELVVRTLDFNADPLFLPHSIVVDVPGLHITAPPTQGFWQNCPNAPIATFSESIKPYAWP